MRVMPSRWTEARVRNNPERARGVSGGSGRRGRGWGVGDMEVLGWTGDDWGRLREEGSGGREGSWREGVRARGGSPELPEDLCGMVEVYGRRRGCREDRCGENGGSCVEVGRGNGESKGVGVSG